MTELHMYTNETDTVIAYSPEDANAVLIEHWGMVEEDVEGLDDWHEWTDKEKFTLYYDQVPDEDDKPFMRRSLRSDHDNWEWMVKATVAEWIVLRGRGFFASSEY